MGRMKERSKQLTYWKGGMLSGFDIRKSSCHWEFGKGGLGFEVDPANQKDEKNASVCCILETGIFSSFDSFGLSKNSLRALNNSGVKCICRAR
jgi:hypothetical protein